MPKYKLSFSGTKNTNLIAEFDTPDNVEENFIALYAPCFTCTKNLRAIKYIAQALNQNGISLFRFDFPGLGESDGDFKETNFSSNLENLRFAYNFLKTNYKAPKLLIGHSLGGAAMMRLAMELESVEAVVIIASPDIPSHLANKLKRNWEEANTYGVSKRVIGGIEFDLTKQFFDDLIENDKYHNLRSITKPVLVMYSNDDDTIKREYAFKNFEEVSGPKSFIELNNTGHLMMKPSDALNVGNMISSWALSYVK